MNAIILCGGLSTRLGDITKDTPKILLPIGDRTVLDWQLMGIRELGIHTVVLAAGHLAHVLEREVGPIRQGVHIRYAVEPERLGTGGALKHAWQYVPEPETNTLVLNGDILTSARYTDIVGSLTGKNEGVILGVHVGDTSSYGTLLFDEGGHLNSFQEKTGIHLPGYINGGVYVFRPQVKEYFPAQPVFSIEYDVFPRVNHLQVYASQAPWIDVGVPERLEWARAHWQEFYE